MQNGQVYGHPKLASIGTPLRLVGAFSSVGSMNFQRSRTPGSRSGCASALSRSPAGRWGPQSRRASRISSSFVNPNT
jgi:hypothetical protein